MKSVDNYIAQTPVYKIWVDIIDISITNFSDVLSEKSFLLNEVICNRTGVHFFYVRENDLLEIHYNQIKNEFYSSQKNIKTEEAVSIGAMYRLNNRENKIISKNDLIDLIMRWKQILRDEVK